MPPGGCYSETKHILPPCWYKADFRGLGYVRWIRNAISGRSYSLLFSGITPWLTGWNNSRIAKAECPSRISTPC